VGAIFTSSGLLADALRALLARGVFTVSGGRLKSKLAITLPVDFA